MRDCETRLQRDKTVRMLVSHFLFGKGKTLFLNLHGKRVFQRAKVLGP